MRYILYFNAGPMLKLMGVFDISYSFFTAKMKKMKDKGQPAPEMVSSIFYTDITVLQFDLGFI